MRRGRRRHVRTAGLFAILAVCAFFLGSCSLFQRKDGFSLKLASVDSLIGAGENAKALKRLGSLRRSAAASGQWLSIAKRERSLGSNAQAEVTLRKAARALPANAAITAVLVDTLLEQEKYGEALGFADIIKTTSYVPLAAYAGIRHAGEKYRNETSSSGDFLSDPAAMNPVWWRWAYDATQDPLFLRNEAVLYALAGNFAAACPPDTRPSVADDVPGPLAFSRSLPREAFFRALLCYDAGFYDRVFAYLGRSEEAGRNAAELSLLADTAVRAGDIPLARSFWGAFALRLPALSPLPYYNLAATSDNAPDMKSWLESCLALFPAYYPAVARYVRSVPASRTESAPDPVAGELERAGFRSLEMEENARRAPVDASAAAAVLARSLETPSGAGSPDMRLRIEEFRFFAAQTPDRIRSSSQMWKLLETTRDDPAVRRYAVWFFASIGNFDASLSLNRSLEDGAMPFYTALEASFSGDLDRAEEYFGKAADDSPEAWRALANIARIREKRHDYAAAIEDLSVATGMTGDDRVKSMLQYATAVMLVETHMEDRAADIAAYALELDPSNYRAALLLRELESVR